VREACCARVAAAAGSACPRARCLATCALGPARLRARGVYSALCLSPLQTMERCSAEPRAQIYSDSVYSIICPLHSDLGARR
jgi:hypothetical protein